MRALEPEVANAVWEAVEGLIPKREVNHPMGGHRPRIPDHICLLGILIRLVTGWWWVSTEHLLGGAVSDTTLRARRDEWTEAGVFDAVVSEALAAYDRIIGLDLSDVSVDGSQHKAPCGGEGTGKNPCDRAKLGFKWSLATDRAGIPVGWAIDGANRHDSILFDPTLAAVDSRGLVLDIETLHLDRGYDSNRVRNEATARGIDDIICPKKRPRSQANHIKIKTPTPLGMRWTVERTNSWLSNYGQLRRNTDRNPQHRLAQLALAITFIITIKLINWRNRWNPTN